MDHKAIKELMTSDLSSSVMNCVRFTLTIAASPATKQYLDDNKIL